MMPRHARNIEDLGDQDVARLRRIGFAGAVYMHRLRRSGVGLERPVLTVLEEFVEQALGANDGDVSHRYAVAQAATFLSDSESMNGYIPPLRLADAHWLRFVVDDLGHSDTEIAFLLARHADGPAQQYLAEVRAARTALALSGEQSCDDDDTLVILDAIVDRAPHARDFLGDSGWLENRVVTRDLSDGAIAAELGRLGIVCDRSTVRLYRRNYGLRRPSYDE